MVACLSTECSSCESAMEAMLAFSSKNPEVNLVGFIHTTDELFILLEEHFKNQIPVFRISKSVMNEKLKVYSFPLGFTLNEQGQVLRTEPCGAEFVFEMLKLPLRKLI
ncbi:hypothetical protein PCURB6_14310 [Paenibacillus curdlanolyticus]|nr:hypothetical protein PCURB6_14310 [Paenibacillus curdlanolyticus]